MEVNVLALCYLITHLNKYVFVTGHLHTEFGVLNSNMAIKILQDILFVGYRDVGFSIFLLLINYGYPKCFPFFFIIFTNMFTDYFTVHFYTFSMVIMKSILHLQAVHFFLL